MKIGKPKIEVSDQVTSVKFTIDSSRGSETLWYQVDRCFGDFLTQNSDAAAVALLVPAMEMGEDLIIEGSVSEKLYYHLIDPIQKLLVQVIPFLNIIRLDVENLTVSTNKASGVCTGFSAGIDSFSALADYYLKDVPEGLKLTHLLYNNVGSHFERSDSLFNIRFSKIFPVAERFGLPFIKVNSNLDSFYRDTPQRNLGFGQTHTIRNATVPLILQNGIGRFYYETGYSNNEISIKPTDEISHVDPILLGLLSTETVDMLSVGGEYTRVEKTKIVANIPESYNSLDVCLAARADGSNCSTCFKCMRTQLTLDIAGCKQLYDGVFDSVKYGKNKDQYIGEIIASTRFHSIKLKNVDPLIIEIDNFSKETNYKYCKSNMIMS